MFVLWLTLAGLARPYTRIRTGPCERSVFSMKASLSICQIYSSDKLIVDLSRVPIGLYILE